MRPTSENFCLNLKQMHKQQNHNYPIITKSSKTFAADEHHQLVILSSRDVKKRFYVMLFVVLKRKFFVHINTEY